ncbi:MAG: ParA family protein, partial [Planctomycetaceae bacterium]
MKAPVLTFANNRDGAGKASLIHHLAWMLASLNKRVIAVDLDPQMHLTSAFLDNEQVESILAAGSAGSTIHQCVQSLSSYGALSRPVLQEITNGLWFLPGDINLSGFEDELSTAWHRNLTHPDQYALRVLTALSQILQWAAADIQPDLLLVDLGPGLGALNRSGLFATDYIAIPLDSDPASLHGLRPLGAALKNWKQSWQTQAG